MTLFMLTLLAPFQMGLNKEKWKKAVQTQTEDDKSKEEKKVVVGKECGSPETLSKVEKNTQTIKSKASTWGVAVEDKGKGYCGYDMVSGRKIKRVDGEKSEDHLISELTGFFIKKK